MRVKLLVEGKVCDIVAVMDGDECPAADFLNDGDANTEAWRDALAALLEHVADEGLQNIPTALVRQANKNDKIYEFRKGRLRLFFFHGVGRQVAVCTTGVVKKTQKADGLAVKKAATYRKKYEQAVSGNELEVISG